MSYELFTTEMFNEYLNLKKISPRCPCCDQDVLNYMARGMESRAKVIEDGRITTSSDKDDNVGLGFIYTIVDSNGLQAGIRQGAYGVFLFRCENCGYLRTFDAEFVKAEYKQLKREQAGKKE